MNAVNGRSGEQIKRARAVYLRLRRICVLLGLTLLAALLSTSTAQPEPLTLSAPNSRFAAPGDFVTLVFRIEASQTGVEETLEVDLEARSSLGWQILRQPGEVSLEPGQSRPIALTLAVPINAPAFAENTVMVGLRSPTSTLSAQSVITVSERSALSLEAPETVVLNAEGFSVTLVNEGNVASSVRLELLERSEVLAVRERELAPQERLEERLEVASEGSYTLVLTNATNNAEEVRKRLTVTRFGVPSAQPFSLLADASVSFSTEGWSGELSADGPLSDFVSLSARLDAKDELSSYMALTHERWTAQLGGGGSDPYGLGLSAGVGAAGSYRTPRWAVAGALGGVSESVSGYAAGTYRSRAAFVAGGLSVRADDARFSVRGSADLGALSVEAEASYDDFIDASLEAKRNLPKGSLQGRLRVAQLLTESANLGARLDYYGSGEHLYASGSLPLGEDVRVQEGWSIGLQDRLVLDDLSLPGKLNLGLEMGSEQGFARLRYETTLADRWFADAQFGVVYDDLGLGLDTSVRVSQSSADYYSLGGDLTYYPRSSHLGGQVDLKLQTTHAPLTFFGNSTWDLTDKRLGLNAGTVWYGGPWRVNLAGNANYGYGSHVAESFAFGLSLSSDYTFDVRIPSRVSELAGGRRTGMVRGVVRSDAGPLAGVEVKVGRYKLLTDEAGRYRAELAPGTYKVSLEVASLPITYRLIGEDTVSVEVALKGEVVRDFRLARTAALTGRVLEDADADGVADTPERGLAARLLLIDPEGLYRSLSTDEQGNFSARGLLPGEATLQLASYPIGSVILGDATRKLTVRAGEIVEVTFLLQPARTRARSFGSSALRVRRVTPSAERVPPGSAPLVSVTLQGDPERVRVATSAGSTDLSLIGDVWLGRVNVPGDTPPGVYTFEVIAKRGDERASRRGQFVIDTEIPLLEAVADGPVRAGETLDLSAAPLFEAAEVSAQSPLGDVQLTEVEPGQYAADLPIAADTEDAVYDLLFRAVRSGGAVVEETRRVRVLNTP